MIRHLVLFCLAGLLLGLLSLAGPTRPARGATPTPVPTHTLELATIPPAEVKGWLTFGRAGQPPRPPLVCAAAGVPDLPEPAALRRPLPVQRDQALPPSSPYPVCACGYAPDELLQVTLRDPLGQPKAEFESAAQRSYDPATGIYVTSCYGGEELRQLAFLPGDPVGPYTLEITGRQQTFHQTFELLPLDRPAIYYANPLQGYVLAGFAPHETVTILAFRQTGTEPAASLELRESSLSLDETGGGLITDTAGDTVLAVRGSLEMVSSNPDEAMALWYYDREIQRDPARARAYFQRGRRLLSRNPEQALADLNQAAALDPAFAPVYLDRARYYAARDDTVAVLADLSRAITAAPRLSEAYRERGGLYQQMNLLDRYRPANLLEKAAADYSYVLALQPGQAYLERAQVFAGLGELELAEADYQAALTLAKAGGPAWWRQSGYDPARVYLARAEFFHGREDHERAAQDARTALGLDYTSPPVLLLVGAAGGYHGAGEMAAGRLGLGPQDYALAVDLAPDFGPAYAGRGEHGYSQDPGQACADFERATSLDPGLAAAHDTLGQVYQAQGRVDEAIDRYSQVIRLWPGYLPAYYRRAQLYEAQGLVQLAIADYSSVIKADPAGEAAHYYHRARLYAGQAHKAAAAADYQRAVELEDGRWSAAEQSQKLADLAQAVEFNPGSARAFYWRGVAYDRQGDVAPALADYSRAIELYPTYLAAYQARAALYDSGRLGAGYERAAVDDYSRIIALAPAGSDSLIEAYQARVALYDKLDDTGGAMGDYSQLVQLTPRPDYFYARAHLYQHQQRLDRAAGDYMAAFDLTTQPGAASPASLDPGGDIFTPGQNAAPALDPARLAANLHAVDRLPNFAPAYYWRGEYYCLYHATPLALADFRRVIALTADPDLSARAEQRLTEGCGP